MFLWDVLKARLTNISNKSYTFPFENRKNIAVVALSPDGNVLISVDEGEPATFIPLSTIIQLSCLVC